MEERWQNKCSWNTIYSADSVEWCPVAGYHDVMVCGTYQLRENDQEENKTQKRVGRIYLFNIGNDVLKLEPIQTIETSGILDQKWCYHKIKEFPVLAAVTSVGNIQLYQLSKNEDTFNLKLWVEETVGDFLALSVDWSSNKYFNDVPHLIVSDSSGSVSLWTLEGDKLNKLGVWNAHGFEAWIAAFDYWDPNVFYSGGDDSLMKCFDSRVPERHVSIVKGHDAGVTAISSHTHVQYRLLTGSYDEKIRLWDTRNLKRSVTEKLVNGGVWRLKWCPYEHDAVLVACMYGGFCIAKLDDCTFIVVAKYLEHESIGYGADWKWDGGCQLIGTCSFYDCKLDISRCQL